MLDGVLLLWFILTGLSLIFVVWDSISNTPVSWVQKLAWILVTAYTGPIGLFLYMLACRNPGPRLHGAFTLPHWKQAVNSEMHCLAATPPASSWRPSWCSISACQTAST